MYGSDNRLMLDTLKNINTGSRAVIALQNDIITQEELDELHSSGVRGVRINLKTTRAQLSANDPNCQIAQDRGSNSSSRLANSLHLGLKQMNLIVAAIPRLNIRIVVDHIASPDPCCEGSSQTGYSAALELLQKGLIWVKISGTYRFANLPDLDEYARALISTAPEQVNWASDWPHTGRNNQDHTGPSFTAQDYRQVDDVAFVKKCFEWCDFDQRLIKKLFVKNPKRLWS